MKRRCASTPHSVLPRAGGTKQTGPLLVVQVARNDFELILNRSEAPVGGGRLFFSLYATPMAELSALIAAAGLELRDGYWGMPIKVRLDPDGNELFFAPDD
ncbi:MAG TPA: hypothetical protein VJN18_24400 [Polyangiaceae bacterium]|nr:hypothetical protein [Polyangiaceae bacterium]